MKFAKYSSYKDSGFNWIGEIPTNWGIKRVGHHIDFITGFAFKSEHFSFDSGIKLVRGDNVTEGMLRWGDKTRYWPVISNDIKQYLLCEKDILIGMDGSKVGKNHTLVQRDDLPLLLVQRVARLRTDEQLNYKYLYHLISSNLFKVWVALVKTDPAIPHISPADIKGFPLPFPSIDEQQKIANFLDHETANIDTLIDKQEKLIELLKEKRQAVISHAVTKGLNPDAPMKYSGVEWLGEVPEHWTVGRVKNLAKLISKGTTPSTIGGDFIDEGIRFLKGENIGKSLFVNPSPTFYISEEVDAQLSRSRLQENDVLVIIAGATTGKASILTKDLLPANTNQAVSFIRPKKAIYSKLITLWLSTEFAQRIIWMGAVQAAQPNLSMENLGNLPIVLPDEGEIASLLNEIDKKVEQFDALIIKANSAIELMKERKIALISAAVTGKIDVRDWELK